MTEKLMSKTDTITRPKIAPKTAMVEPPEFRVIYVNDDVTTQEFVIETLKIVFNYEEEAAEALTMRVHEEGSATVAVLPFEIAETVTTSPALNCESSILSPTFWVGASTRNSFTAAKLPRSLKWPF